jgi:hypothetical protein
MQDKNTWWRCSHGWLRGEQCEQCCSTREFNEKITNAVLAEREACAELIFEIGSAKLAAAIRARGNNV